MYSSGASVLESPNVKERDPSASSAASAGSQPLHRGEHPVVVVDELSCRELHVWKNVLQLLEHGTNAVMAAIARGVGYLWRFGDLNIGIAQLEEHREVPCGHSGVHHPECFHVLLRHRLLEYRPGGRLTNEERIEGIGAPAKDAAVRLASVGVSGQQMLGSRRGAP